MRRRTNKTILVVLMISIVFVTVEGISYIGLWWLAKHRDIEYQPLLLEPLSPKYQRSLKPFVEGKAKHILYSRTLGWKPKANQNYYSGEYVTNSMAIRHDREFAMLPSSGTTRIATFGESYTQGHEVGNKDTWQEQLMSLEPDLEALNFGVGGYGLDQAYLRYMEEGSKFAEHIAIIGYMTENLSRNVNVYVPFYVGERAGMPVTKPRFILKEKQLVHVPNPMESEQDYLGLLQNSKQVLTRLGRYDYHFNSKYKQSLFDIFRTIQLIKIGYYRFKFDPIYTRHSEYNTDSEAFRLLLGLFDAFYREALKNNVVPIILIYPNYTSLVPYYEHKIRVYHHLTDWLEARNYLYLDLLEPLLELGEGRPLKYYFTHGVGHYTPFGNRLVAKAVQAFIVENNLDDSQHRRSIITTLRKQHLF